MKRFEGLLMLVVVAVAATLILGVVLLHAETKPELTKEQRLVLENAQLKLKLSYVALQTQQQDFQQKMTDFNQVCQEIVKANGLPEGTRCNPETLELVKPEVKK